MGQRMHLHNYIVYAKDNENGSDGKQKTKEYQITGTLQPSPLQNTPGVLKGRRKSITNISFQSNVNNLCCLCFLLLLFIYLLLSFQKPVLFLQRLHGQGSCIKLLSLVSKGFFSAFIYIFILLYTCLVVIW